MKTEPKVAELLKSYSGKQWKIAPKAAKIFAHEEYELPIRFLGPKKMTGKLIEVYYDYLLEEVFKCINDEGEWVESNLTPIAAVGYAKTSEDDDDDSFLDDSFAFLFYETKGGKIIYTTSDDWSRDNVLKNLDQLGLHKS